MCGIVGIFNINEQPASAIYIEKMADLIAHRGPDDAGYVVDQNVALGHRRLSIIDLSPSAHQPMVSPDGQFTLVYNGEIYNFRELRLELEALGHTFRSQSDAEVVLRAYMEWREKALDKFNGMFAFAVFNKHDRSLFLARDRYGVKPLYYTYNHGSFLFSSEIKAFNAHPSFEKQVDKEGLLEYFTFQNFFTYKTLFKGVSILPPGHFMVINNQTDTMTPISYWDYHFEEPSSPRSDDEYLEELDRLFVQAVSRQLVSDVEVGTYLSGGVDSGSITAISAKQLAYIKSFTCGFDLSSASGLELSFDERKKAEFMSAVFKTEHYEMVLKSGDMERCLPTLAYHLEEPRVGQSYPNFYASKLASKFVKVVLSGAGGDELFGGYPWRYYRAVKNDNFDDYVDKYYVFWQRLIDNRYIKEIFAPIWNDVSHVWTRDIFRDVFQHHKNALETPEDYINHSLYFECKTFLHGLLVVEDKLSMAHSLETRVPFLDNDLVDFAMKLPVHLKLSNLGEVLRINENDPSNKNQKYFKKTKDGKLLLRKMMKRYVPEDITNATKQGFSAPDASWFKGESIEYVKSIIFDSNARIYNFFDQSTVQRLVNEHLSGKENRRLFIWSLLNFELFCKEYSVN